MRRAHATVGLAIALLLTPIAGAAGTAAAQSGETVTVTVAVRDSADNPIDGADLNAEWDGGSTTATTAANGKAFVDVPEGAEVTIEVTHPRYVRNSPYVVSEASEREVEVEVFRKSSVRLEVSDQDGPVEGARILIERGGLDVATGETGSNGVYESGVLQAGDYTVTVRRSGYYVRRKPLEIDGNVTNRVALRAGSVAVDVSVVDPHFDSPRSVADARVNLTGFATSRTGPDGATALRTPVNVRTTLQVRKEGYRSTTRDVQVGEENASFTVELSRIPSLTIEATNDRVVAGERAPVAVTNAYGEPAPGVTVTLDGEAVGETDADGELAVRIDDPGDRTLRATSGDVRSNEIVVEAIEPRGDATATASQPSNATATGTPDGTEVVTPGFTPVAAVIAVLAVAALLRRR
jgi:PGF-CTERM protein